MEKNIKYYLDLPYTRELIPEPEGGWFVRIKELPGCMSQGDTPEEAMGMISEAMVLWLETALDHGMTIPEPRLDEDYSGKFVVRLPKSLHRKCVEHADQDDVSLNQWVVSALSEAVGVANSKKIRKYQPKTLELSTSGGHNHGKNRHHTHITCLTREIQ
ncbi:MAG: toxin-antitoxin system HicB family antitoxin [Chloroflexota bacterium]|nr:toxin-antitoxin system HicB family antitoxin [Chloroflexota bacterium]